MAEHVHTTLTPFVRRGGDRPAGGVRDRRGSADKRFGLVIPFPRPLAAADAATRVTAVGLGRVKERIKPADHGRIAQIVAEVAAIPVADLMGSHDRVLMMPHLFEGDDFVEQCEFKAMLCLCRFLDAADFRPDFRSGEI